MDELQFEWDEDKNIANIKKHHVDFNDDIVPRGVYLLFDKILDENYGKYMSIGDISIDSYKQEYKEFEEKIGG